MSFECCRICEKREPGCHGKCEDYITAKTKHDEFKKELFRRRSHEYDYESRVVELSYRRIKERSK